MNTYQLHLPMRRKHLSATVFGAAAITLAVGGLAQPAVSQAAWDIEKYDKCMQEGKDSDIGCCLDSGGEVEGWPEAKCVAPLTAQTPPQSPGELNQVPGTGTFGQTEPAPQSPGQAPQPGTATPSQPGAQGPILRHPWLR